MKKLILYILSGLLLFAGCTTTTEGFEQSEVLVVSLDNINAESSESSIIVKVNSLTPYEIISTEGWSWITPSKKYGESGNSEFILTIEKNESVNKRTAIITVQNLLYGLSHNITVMQSAVEPYLYISKSSIGVSGEGGKESITITSNIMWTASCDADWVTLSSTNGKKGNTTLDITIKAIAIDTYRTATVKIANSEYLTTATVNIKQMADYAILYTSDNGEVVTPYKTNVFGANIVSNTYNNGQGIIVFDAPVTSIGDWAFYNCTSLTSVTISNSVTSIGDSAFRYCTSLTGVIIPDSVTSIGDDAFESCSSLTSVTIPDSVTSIGDDAFESCTSLKAFYGKYVSADNRCLIVDGVLHSFAPAGLTQYTIPNSVTSIGRSAFGCCSSLTSVTIPDSVTSIGWDAFDGCTSLTSITIPDSVTSIGNTAFCSCSSLTSVTIPDSVTSIGMMAFFGCTSLTSVTIGNGVTSIEDEAFESCDSLKAFYGKFASSDNRCLIVDGVLKFFAHAGLTQYTIPNSVTKIGVRAFDYCDSLTSVTIPDSVTSIGAWAFSSCDSLTSITIPDGVTSIGRGAFWYCTSLEEVYCKPTTPPTGGDDMFYNNASGRKIYVPRNSVSAYKAKQYWSDYADYIVGYDF